MYSKQDLEKVNGQIRRERLQYYVPAVLLIAGGIVAFILRMKVLTMILLSIALTLALAVFVGGADIGESAFGYCNKLETVILPKEATYIGEHVFDHAVNLKRLAIGDKTTGYDDRVTYSSFGRRDPFVEIKGLVEEGINIDQVELVGIIWESDVPMAILVESKNPSISYTLKEGDKILNGKVLKITQTDVLFLIQEFGVSRRYSMGLPDKFGGQK